VSSSFEMPDLDVLTTGAIGPPGQRVFYLQARHGASVVTLRLEKQQVAAMAEYLAGMLADLSSPDPAAIPVDVDLQEPIVAEWVVGSLAVAYDETADRLVIVAEELLASDEPEGADDEVEGAVARFVVTREQVAGFVTRAQEVVAAGRPPCRFCGGPLDPERHVCPKSNGHRTR
jgi:uncharacterized repeat protein (TIGR03847 family)